MADPLLLLSAGLIALIITAIAVRQLLGTRGLVIGPWIWGFSHSKGYPMRPQRLGKGWWVRFKPNGSLHAVLDYGFRIPAGATKLVLSYTAEIHHVTPTENPGAAPLVSLVLQRRGDDWTGKGAKASYRLYSPAFPLKSGVFTATIQLAGWTNVWGQPADIAPVIADLSNLAVAFGHSAGRMHGVSGAGTFTLTSLEAIP